MTWNYRLVQVGDSVGLYEVLYNEEGIPHARTEDPICFCAESEDELIRDLELALEDVRESQVIDDGELPRLA